MRETHIFIPQIKVVDGSLLFLLTLGAFDRPGSFHSALLYSINPEATSPEFHCNGRFSSLASKTTIYGFVGDKVIFSSLNSQNQQYIGVWYWKQDITFIWDSGWPTVYDVNFLEDINLLVSTTMGFDEVDCYHCPTLSEHPNARSGQVNEIENKELYYCPWGSELTALGERLFITPIAPTPAAFPEYPLKSQKPYRWEWLMKLKAPEESANEFSGNVILFDQVWIEKWGSSQSEFPVWWAPKIVKSTEIPASQIGTGKLDLPYSLSMGEPREWRIMWWEDAESERILRYQYCFSYLPCLPTRFIQVLCIGQDR
ncbi:hypothetical protein DL96DRAFT_1572493 [Flagelloscypha sp. PMI_526]|nr:hypothetical protein DL96DRAFT_1572493 [Flagelloscypha sp. PMI_526]